MTQVSIRPLLAPEPAPRPPARRWLFLLPLLLAALGILLATVLAIQGQATARRAAELELALQRAHAANALLEGQAAHADPAALARLAKNLVAARHAGIPSYRRPGRQFTNWDGYRYEEIIDQGYIYESSNSSMVFDPAIRESRLKNVVWYPLYPVLAMAASALTGLATTQALTLVSQLCAALGAVAFFACVRQHYYNRPQALGDAPAPPVAGGWDLAPADAAALWATTLLLFGPFGFFLYANFTESLFVLLLALFLLSIQRRWWLAAAVVAACASATRSQGVLFGPVLALVYLLRADAGGWLRRVGFAALLGVISGLGLAVYMAFLSQRFGDPLAFMRPQQFWHVGLNRATFSFALNPLNSFTNACYWLFAPGTLDLPRLLEAWSVILPPALLIVFGRRLLSFEQQLLGWILWGLPFISNSLARSTDPGVYSHWMSMGRFMSVALPLQIILGGLVVRRRWLGPVLLAVFATFFALFCFRGGEGWWLG